jgi:type IV secretory pathway ATPase VirB11/archaellum biosynthesis ATPase
MAEHENGNRDESRSLLEKMRQWRSDADKGREPELLSSRLGTRHYSQAALIEKIVDAFLDEHGGGSDALNEADTETKRIKLILGTTDYVLGVESIQVSLQDKAAIIRRVYNEMFTYGPLDALFDDESITTITLEGADKVAVRRRHGELETLAPLFENENHLRKVIRRLLIDSGAELTPEDPIIETGLVVNGRHISLNIAGPPVTIKISVDIRVHPRDAHTLHDLIEQGVMSGEAGSLLRALAESQHGIVIVGEAESGKTTLLGAVIQALPEDQQAGLVAVQRAGELQLPAAAGNYTVRWRTQDQEPVTFGGQIQAALAHEGAACLVLDEVRADEPTAIEPLLKNDGLPRQIWTMRGPASSKRLVSALGMLARRSSSDPGAGESLVQALYRRLPFVITLRRREDRLQVAGISQWQFQAGNEYPDLVELMVMGWEGLERTGKRPTLALALPGDFWG